jgi:Fe-S-cluster containining protein
VSSRYARPAAAVRALYRRLDRRIASFRRASGLACPRGCGQCCLSPEVEATELEMLPVALHLRAKRRLEAVLASLGQGEEPHRTCVFYSPDPLGAFGGHCGVYPWRPLLCRLFGYAAVADREGRPVLSVCRVMRDSGPDQARAASEAAAAVADGRLRAPLMRDGSLAVYCLDPDLGSRPQPINAALKQGLERVGLETALARRRRKR